jgi:hypothetical protein
LTLGHSEADYETKDYYDKKTDYGRVGVRYSPTDLLYFDFGVKKTKGDSPNYPLLGGSVLGDPVKRMDYELNTQWIVTGYSKLTSRIGWTEERHSRDRMRDFDGLTGNIRWNYSPAGKTTYSIAFDRDTNNAGGDSYEESAGIIGQSGRIVLNGIYTSQRRLVNGLTFNANHSLTSKISLSAGFNYKQYEEEYRQVQDGLLVTPSLVSQKRTGSYKSFSLGATYQIYRQIKLSCNVDRYDRSASLFNREFDGEQVTCAASITLD